MSGDPFEAVNPEALIGQTLDGRYRVESVLGSGGMGMVFRATQTSIQRQVAIKTLHPQLALAPAFFERFKREAEMASKLHHPNIITIFDFGRAQDGTCYFVMELLEGESLRQRIKREGPFTLRQAAAAIEQAALGVDHAHRQGAVHRDLKPHNIMLTGVDGQEYVKVLDFGLVKALEQEETEQLTSTGQVLGTPQYMPPEQAGGEPVDVRSDIYSLTGVLYYCLTGHSPYGANTVRKALQAALTQEVPKVATYRLGAPVPEAIDVLLRTGLSAEKEDRFQSIPEFITALQAATAGLTDGVLDAIPQNGPTTGKESGSGSGSSSKRTVSGRAASKSVSSVSRPMPRAGSSSRVEVSPSIAEGGAPERRGPPIVPIALGAVLLAVLGVGGAWWVKSSKPEAMAPPSVLAKAPGKAAEAAAPGTFKVTLRTQPEGAEVVEDSVVIGSTPFTTDFHSGTARTFTFKLAGHDDLEKALRPEGEQTLDFELTATRAPNPRSRPTKKKGSDIGAFD